MIKKLLPDPKLFNIGVTTIQKAPQESEEQFNATKDQATFSFEGQSHTLKLDGKIDDIVAQQLRNPERNHITDLEQLKGKTSEIMAACEASEDMKSDFHSQTLDLGLETKWFASPDYNENHEIDGHTLYPIGRGGGHSISVSQEEDGLKMIVSTDTPESAGLGHSMSGLFTNDGQIILQHEGVSYKGE